nr:response regulator transcription factor [Candidatus Microthrix sp.]
MASSSTRADSGKSLNVVDGAARSEEPSPECTFGFKFVRSHRLGWMLTQRIAGVKRTGRDFGPCPLRPRSTKMCSMTGAGRIRIFLVDDHEVVRRGLIDLFDGTGDLEVVGEAGTLASALALVEVLSFDVAVLDVRLPDGSGIELCREIRSGRPAVRCLMLSSFADDEALVDASMAAPTGISRSRFAAMRSPTPSARWPMATHCWIPVRSGGRSIACDASPVGRTQSTCSALRSSAFSS